MQVEVSQFPTAMAGKGEMSEIVTRGAPAGHRLCDACRQRKKELRECRIDSPEGPRWWDLCPDCLAEVRRAPNRPGAFRGSIDRIREAAGDPQVMPEPPVIGPINRRLQVIHKATREAEKHLHMTVLSASRKDGACSACNQTGLTFVCHCWSEPTRPVVNLCKPCAVTRAGGENRIAPKSAVSGLKPLWARTPGNGSDQ